MISKKYNMLHQPLVERIVSEESDKGSKGCEKAVKTRLHQMFGAYVQGNAHKKAAALLQEMKEGKSVGEISTAILALHASTKERLPYLADFCKFITDHTGQIETMMDLGCGFNPFSIPYWGQQNLKAYHAYDIDTRTRDLINDFFTQQDLPLTAACADLIATTPTQKVDLALLCKLLPVLEAQLQGRGYELVRLLDAKIIVVTYPLKSLGGREKGMAKNYAARFYKAQEEGALGRYSVIDSREIGNELVYVLSY